MRAAAVSVSAAGAVVVRAGAVASPRGDAVRRATESRFPSFAIVFGVYLAAQLGKVRRLAGSPAVVLRVSARLCGVGR